MPHQAVHGWAHQHPTQALHVRIHHRYLECNYVAQIAILDNVKWTYHLANVLRNYINYVCTRHKMVANGRYYTDD